MKITGAQALVKALEMEGTEVIFGLPGGCILPAYDPLLDSPIRHILVRHEQGAGHMAEGYAHVPGRPGAVLLDVPKDVMQLEMDWYWPSDDEVADSVPGYRPTTKGHPRMIKEAARMILASERPVLYVGGGILKARAA